VSGPVHRHGTYERWANAEGDEQERIQRLLGIVCGHTMSVLPAHHLPYRPVRSERLEAYFDGQAGISTQGLSPAPEVIEAGCLKRAWLRFCERVERLKATLGQLLPRNV
jgi:hypothetical protein